jgi:preprotein translocase subunit SecY
MMRRRNNSVTIGILLCLGVSSFVIYMLFAEVRQPVQEEKDPKPFLSNENISEIMPRKVFSVSAIRKVVERKAITLGSSLVEASY